MREISSFIGASHRPATPTAFASQISQFPLSRRRRPRSLCESVNSPPYAQSPSTTNRQNKRYAFHPVSALAKATPAPLFSSGRADNACTNLLGYFVWYVRTRGIVEAAESVRLPTFALPPCRTHLPRMTCATNSCTRKEIFKRMENPLKWLLVLLVTQKYDKRKVALWFYRVVEAPLPTN